MPLVRKVKQANGAIVEQAVPLSEYRFLRWPARDLAAGASFIAGARVRVVSVVGQGAAPIAPASAVAR
jgi:hypothetical protein